MGRCRLWRIDCHYLCRLADGGNAILTFWIGYILTRPFGAALGDLLTQTKAAGGLGMGTAWTSALFLSVIVLLVEFAQWTAQPAAMESR